MNAHDVPFERNGSDRKKTRSSIRWIRERVARVRQIVINWMIERLGLRDIDELDWAIAPSHEDCQDLRLKHSSWCPWRLNAS